MGWQTRFLNKPLRPLTARATNTTTNHRCLFVGAGIGFIAFGMFVTLVGCSESPTRAVAVAGEDSGAPVTSSSTVEFLLQENQRLRRQVHSLSKLPDGISVSALYQVTEVQLTRFTGLYDKDKDGKVDQLCVYIRPVDVDGDSVKVAGDVTVQLWDLSGQAPGALLEEWDIASEQLRKEWFSSLMALNYRLLFPLQAEWTNPALSLTVRILFKDHLTGQEFPAQMPVKARP